MLPACDIRQVEPDAQPKDRIEKGLEHEVSSLDLAFCDRSSIHLIPFRNTIRGLAVYFSWTATNGKRDSSYASTISDNEFLIDTRLYGFRDTKPVPSGKFRTWIYGVRSDKDRSDWYLLQVSHERFFSLRLLGILQPILVPRRNLSGKVSFWLNTYALA